ncbi:unnamed protein product [Rhizopus stolonifer]
MYANITFSSEVNESSPQSKGVEEIDPDSYNRESLPNGLKIDDELIADKWISYHVLSAKQLKGSGAFVESNTHKILSLSNVILIKKDQNCQDMQHIFGLPSIKDYDYIKSKFNIKRDILNMDTERKLKKISLWNQKFGKTNSKSVDVKEQNLCGTYVDAIFRPLFEDPSTDNHFVWCDIQVINQSNYQSDFISRAIVNIS